MYLFIIIKSLFIGFLASAPLGPVGMLCIQRTLTESRRNGLLTGLGATTGDMIFALIAIIAALGLGFNTEFIKNHQFILTIITSIILLIFGWNVFRKNPAKNLHKLKESNPTFWKVYVSSTFLTISNVATLFGYIGLFAHFNIIDANRPFILDIIIIICVGIGCFLWWLLITFVVNKLKNKFNPRGLKVFNRIVGIILFGFGIVTAISLFTKVNIM